jgi:hypothetical protein
MFDLGCRGSAITFLLRSSRAVVNLVHQRVAKSPPPYETSPCRPMPGLFNCDMFREWDRGVRSEYPLT